MVVSRGEEPGERGVAGKGCQLVIVDIEIVRTPTQHLHKSTRFVQTISGSARRTSANREGKKEEEREGKAEQCRGHAAESALQ